MNYETIKSFILFVLVGISFLLSFILWSYQPKYDLFYDTSYVNEVDVGGYDKTKNELIEPKSIIFHNGESIWGFNKPLERQRFFKELATWVLYDYQEEDSKGQPTLENAVEITFPNAIPVDLMTNLFTFNDEITTPKWSFDRVYITLNEGKQVSELTIISQDKRKQITATIEKLETYYELLSYMEGEKDVTEEFIAYGDKSAPIYIPKDEIELAKKTFIASMIEPELFIDALFSSPSVVTPNISEAYFTDGQRGMRILQEGRRLEYINPIQSNPDSMDTMELIERSVSNINEHKGWTNDFLLDRLDHKANANQIVYRLYYEGYPTYDHNQLTTIEQKWREQDLYQYVRPLVSIGNLLNSTKQTLPAGEEVVASIMNSADLDEKNIEDIRIGYTLQYEEDAYSLTLDPAWYVLYQGDWIHYNSIASEQSQKKGGG